jgi:hypothetical protein
MPPVEPLRIHAIELAHASRQIAARRFHEQVIVILHQAVSVTAPIKPLHDGSDYGQELLTVTGIGVNRLTSIASRRDMIEGSRVLEP